MKPGTESNSSLIRVNLNITEGLVEVGSNDDIDGLDGTGERLVQVLLRDLELQQGAIHLVDDTDWLDTLSESLAEDGLGLNANTFDAVDDDKSTIGDTESSSDFRGEIDVTGGVNQIDQKVVAFGLLCDILDVILGQLSVQGNGSGLDGDTPVLLVLTSIGETLLTSLGGRNDTSSLNKRVGQSRFSVINCRQPPLDRPEKLG